MVRLLGQRIGPQLEMHDQGLGPLAAFHQPGCPPSAMMFRPDVMEVEEEIYFPQFSRDMSSYRIYLGIRNLILALWSLNFKVSVLYHGYLLEMMLLHFVLY